MGERGDVVHTINFKDLAVVASDLPESRYDNTRRNMMAHMRVLDEVMADHTVLPVRFDCVAPSPEGVREQLLKARYARAEHDARRDGWPDRDGSQGVLVRGRRLSGDGPGESDDPPDAHGLEGHSLEETYYDRIRLGELVEAELKGRRGPDAEGVPARLRPLAEKTQVNATIADHMVVNAAFLITRAREPEFDDAIRKLDSELGHRLLIKCVGPVAPYNFVNVSMHWAA